ncbi:MAG: Rieske 2Fe-2S domain-containing protein [Acidobacteria bacterium]|nr:Rieske 2Fe-2S domain-containing protein [Acidobacteriota bacterium]
MDLADYQPNLDVSRAATLPARWYTDPRFLDLERGKVFGRTWQAVGHAATVEEPGAYFGCEVLGEPLVVARDEEGQLRAFSNVCRHRASLIVTGQGRGSSLRCPYHGWTYSLDGRLLGQPEFEGVEDWDRSGAGLPPARVETWGPYVFINLDPLAPELAEVLGEIPGQVERLGCAAGRLRFSCRREYRLECNWKVYIDNYLEGYHLPVAHPGLFRELDYSQYRVDTFRYHSSQYAPLRPSGDEGEAAGRRYPRENGERKALYFWVFPNFMLNVYPDNLSANIILPEGPDRTLTIFEWFSYGSGEVAPETIAFSDEIQQQDIRLCESVQRGLRSRAYNRGRFSAKRENGVHHFHLLLNEFLAG